MGADQQSRNGEAVSSVSRMRSPKSKMGAGVATSPHLSQVQRVAGEGGRLSRAGRTPSKQAPWGFGVPAEVLRPRSVPYGHLSGEPAGYPFAKPSPEGSGSAGPSKKVGSACASRFFFDCPTIASVACLPKETARFRGGRVLEPSSVAGEPLLFAKRHNVGVRRFAKADSSGYCLWITGISWISRVIARAGGRIGLRQRSGRGRDGLRRGW